MSQLDSTLEAEEIVTLSTADKLEQVAKNVIEIELIYRDEGGEAHVLHAGSGFFIGTAESAPQHVLTSDRVVSLWEEEIDLIQQPEDGESNLEIRIVVKQDVTITATVVTSSEEMGFALLSLEQPIYDRTYMVLNDTFECPETEMEIFSVGIPHGAESESSAQISRGNLLGLEETEAGSTWVHDSYRNEGYIGSPLVDAEGTVIGINQTNAGADVLEATQITEILPVLDALGIGYMTTTKETELQNMMTVSSNMSGAEAAGEKFNRTPVFLIVGTVVFITGIITLIAMIKTKEKRAEKKKKKAEELTVMHAAPVFEKNTRTREEVALIRVKTGQREIIVKESFWIGKERGKTDFYIGDNSAVSRMHACIMKKEAGYFLREYQAINGTFLNDERVYPGDEKQLNSGDKIRLADEEFEFIVAG